MADVFEIPLSPQAQTFTISLGGVFYNIVVAWRDAEGGGWFLDFLTTNDVPILSGVPLVTGADLLGQFEYLGFKVLLVAQTDHDPGAEPTYDNLGLTSHVYAST